MLQIFAGNLSSTAKMENITVNNVSGDSGKYIYDYKGKPICDDHGNPIHMPDPSALLSANTELGNAVNSATSVANLISTTGGVATYLNDAQITTGSYENVTPSKAFGAALSDVAINSKFGDNANLDLALIFGAVSGQFDLVKPADIDAKATVEDVTNLAVNNSATAAANIHTVSVTPVYTPDVDPHNTVSDNIVMASVTQYAFANINAYASVKDVSFTGYSGLGSYNGLTPGVNSGLIVSNTASALGNVSTIANTVKP